VYFIIEFVQYIEIPHLMFLSLMFSLI